VCPSDGNPVQPARLQPSPGSCRATRLRGVKQFGQLGTHGRPALGRDDQLVIAVHVLLGDLLVGVLDVQPGPVPQGARPGELTPVVRNLFPSQPQLAVLGQPGGQGVAQDGERVAVAVAALLRGRRRGSCS
jgi:hypothetical protein